MKNILYIILFFSFITNAQTVGLIVADGQSNMAGVNDISSNPSLLDYKYKASPYTYIFDSLTQNWQYTLVQPLGKSIGLHSQPGRLNTMNPIVSLAFNIDSIATREYYVVMHAVGGTQLYEEVGVRDWNVNSINEHWDSYKLIIQAAINDLTNQGITVDTIYRINYQGEQDAPDLTKANAYYQNSVDLIDSLEVNFNYPFKHYLIEIIDTYTYSSTVNGAKSTIAGERSNVILYENTNFIYSGVHINNTSQIELGDSLFKLIHNY
jgi:hypothetical protein